LKLKVPSVSCCESSFPHAFLIPKTFLSRLLQRMRSQCASLALFTLRRAQSGPLQNVSRAAFSSTRKVAKVNPIDEYAEDPLNAPLNPIQSVTETIPPPPTPPPNERPRTGPEEAALKAQMLFGKPTDAETRQAERDAELKKLSTNIAGVLVPPRPEEPDNCCMSGCVNCVWDRYRDELEDWAAASAEAREKMKAQRAKEKAASGVSQEGGTPSHVMSSMDDDGGGSETNWEAPDSDEGKDLFEGVPVGIREFMKIEKRLKEQQKKAQSAGK
jgi:hypothetical protein